MSLDNLIGMKVGNYEIEKRLGEGAYGVTFKAKDRLHGYVAIKFIKAGETSDWQAEARKAAKLRDVPQIATVFDIGQDHVNINGKNELLNYIVWEYVDGTTLASILEQKKPVPLTLIIDLTEQLCYGIKAMQEVGLEHGDLNVNNIMLIPPKSYDVEQKHRVKIVDFGLARSVRGEHFIKDMEYLALHLKECWKLNQEYAGESLVSDKNFQNLLTDLIARMTAHSLERRLYDPIDVINRIYQIEDQTYEDNTFQNVKLQHPFEYLSVEEMPENSDLIAELYADNVPWLKEIEGYGTTVISGPRGSGKSM
ncbi:MAG TPA: protein kinase, partial [Candidatus Nitrosotalea sp.]|nr:protein kinase [Candidatus Nitrosotalea sp.]